MYHLLIQPYRTRTGSDSSQNIRISDKTIDFLRGWWILNLLLSICLTFCYIGIFLALSLFHLHPRSLQDMSKNSRNNGLSSDKAR